MAWTRDNVESTVAGTSGQNNATLSAFTLGAGDNRRVFVLIELEDPNPFMAVTQVEIGASGAVGSQIVQEDTDAGGSNFNTVVMWSILEADLPAAGDYDIKVTFDDTFANNNDVGICAVSYTDITQDAPRDTAVAINNGVALISDSLTVVTGDLMLSVVGNGGSTTYTHGTGQTELVDQQPSSSTQAVTEELATASGSHTVSHTASSAPSRHIMACASFAPSGPSIPVLAYHYRHHIGA
jgi:hypothetical protein